VNFPGKCPIAFVSIVLGWGLVFSGAKEAVADVMMPTAAGSFSVGIRSMQELRFQETVRQGYDFSCGSAALATLLTYHYDRPRTEVEIFEKMWNHGDKKKIRKNGFSMLDMKRYLESEGFSADGFKIPLERIKKLNIAGLILLVKLETPHFVVVIGHSDGELLISDPAKGIWNMSLEEVSELWNGVFFLVRDRASLARSNFNDPEVWKRRRWSPIEDAEMAQWIVPLAEEIPMSTEFNAN
jgi:predicted double-glycine peptidase